MKFETQFEVEQTNTQALKVENCFILKVDYSEFFSSMIHFIIVFYCKWSVIRKYNHVDVDLFQHVIV